MSPVVSQNHQQHRQSTKLPEFPLPPLLGASLPELTNWVQTQGQPAYRGKQLHDWIYNKGVRSLTDISAFPKTWREQLTDIPIGRADIDHKAIALMGQLSIYYD